MCAGTAFNASCSDSRSSPQVPITITATIARLTAGSSQYQPVYSITTPATATPRETAASAIMCK